MSTIFYSRKQEVEKRYETLIGQKNTEVFSMDGYTTRYAYPVLTAAHVPPSWRYDFNPETNPYYLERLGINAAFNPGAIYHNDKFYLMARVEGYDRKSFLALAESESGVDGFQFTGKPIELPQTDEPDTNVYDMRLVQHEDGWIYGLFCTERKDKNAKPGDESSANAQCGIVRTRDLQKWERLPDLKTSSPQQRNVVLHPEFVDGKYGLYTRPQDGFIEAGKGGGIAFGLSDSMENAVVSDEKIIDPKTYHTIKEVKNGQGPAPLKTEKGWIHIAHGVRNTAAGLRYVVYLFMTALDDLTKVLHRPSGYFLAPQDDERIGDVSNVVFVNGWVQKGDEVFIYYASSDTRCHVAKTTVQILTDYVTQTPEDPLYSHLCVKQRCELIDKNRAFLRFHKR